MRASHRVQRTLELFFPERQELVQRGKSRKQVVILPNVALQHASMIGQPVDDLGRRQSITLNLFCEVFRSHSRKPPAKAPARGPASARSTRREMFGFRTIA